MIENLMSNKDATSPLWISHRGLKDNADENTLEARPCKRSHDDYSWAQPIERLQYNGTRVALRRVGLDRYAGVRCECDQFVEVTCRGLIRVFDHRIKNR